MPTSRPPGFSGRAGALAGALLLAAGLRLGAFLTLPGFFGPGDPAIYFAMARGCAREGAPWIGFVWHFLTWPDAIRHIEDYCEPGFAYLLALPLLIGGGSVTAARFLSLLCGVLAVVLVFFCGRRLGRGVALVAAVLVAVEPWSVYYSGVIMKETTVSVVVLLFAEALRRAAAGGRLTGAGLGALTIGASLVQYELLPILTATTAVTLYVHRRSLLRAYLVTAGLGALVLLGATLWAAGVPISAKLGYFAGRSLWDPLQVGGASDAAGLVARFLPVRYMVGSVVAAWYPALLALAWLGARRPEVMPAERTLLAAFGLSFVYFHGVPQDLQPRDIIPATAVFAPFAALALCDVVSWRARAWGPALAAAMLVFVTAAPHVYHLARHFGLTPSPGPAWPGPALLVALTGGAFALVRLTGRWLPAARLGSTVPMAMGLAVLLNYHASLPLTIIPGNPQYPGYEAARAERERVGASLRNLLDGAPVMAAAPWEVQLYSGAPCVKLPRDVGPEAIRVVSERYRTRWLLVRSGELRAGVRAGLPVDEIMRLENHTLYRFRDSAGARKGRTGVVTLR